MADFNTHIFWAGAAASLGAIASTKLLGLSANETLLLTLLGTVGGILPDIDLRHSTPSQMLFSFFGTLAALCWLFANVGNYSALSLWAISITVFFFVRYPIWMLFHQFTVHRGALHSLAAALMFMFCTAAAASKVFYLNAVTSWLCAVFVASGFVLHLILDEIYSVDFMGVRIKKSFGSALKVLDMQRLFATCFILLICFASWFFTPSLEDVWKNWQTMDVNWRTLMLPEWLLQRT